MRVPIQIFFGQRKMRGFAVRHQSGLTPSGRRPLALIEDGCRSSFASKNLRCSHCFLEWEALLFRFLRGYERMFDSEYSRSEASRWVPARLAPNGWRSHRCNRVTSWRSRYRQKPNVETLRSTPANSRARCGLRLLRVFSKFDAPYSRLSAAGTTIGRSNEVK